MDNDAPEQKASEREKVQARQAAERWNERVDDGFLELEKEALDDSKLDHSGYIGARSSADLAQQSDEALQSNLRSGPTARNLGEFNNTVAEAKSNQTVDTETQASGLRDTRRMEMAKVGQNVAANTSSGLKKSAQLGASRAGNKLQNQVLRDNARTQAVFDAAKGAVQGYAMKGDGFELGMDGLKRYKDNGELDKDASMGPGKTGLSMLSHLR